MDTLVFDIETKNFFTDPGVGRDNFGALEISVVGVYSYAEDELEKLAELFREAERIIGFSINRYDVPVLNLYFQKLSDRLGLDLFQKERVDLLEEIELVTGKRISLGKLAQANLGAGKTGTGAQAIELYREGKIDELKAYCLKDVELTKGIYELYRERKFLYVPHYITGEIQKIEFMKPSYAKTANLF